MNYADTVVVIKRGTREYQFQLILVVLSIIYLCSLLVSLFNIYYRPKDNQNQQNTEVICIIGVYLIGLASQFALMFSPTMLASGTRVYFFFYMAQIWIVNSLLGKVHSKVWRNLCYVALFLGIVLNVITIIMLQMKNS